MNGLPEALRRWWIVWTVIVIAVGWFIRVDMYLQENQKRDAAVNDAIYEANKRAAKSDAILWSLHFWAEGVSEKLKIARPPDVTDLARPAGIALPLPSPPQGWADAFEDAGHRGGR